jgi:hypothetical protein
LVDIHRQRAAAVQRVIPVALYRAAFVAFAGAARRFQVAFAVVPGEQHVVAEFLVGGGLGEHGGVEAVAGLYGVGFMVHFQIRIRLP